MQTGGDIPVSSFNTSPYILEKTLATSTIILKGMSEIIHNCIQNGMGWGILIIILLHCASARAAPMEVNGSSSIELSGSAPMEINGSISLDQSSIPEAFSTLSAGAKTTIYGATTVFTKNYILNLGDVEGRLTGDISDSFEAISVQDDICKKNSASFPMVHLNKENYGSSMKKNF